jgi:hypothetical protein
MIKYLILILLIFPVSAYVLTGDNLIEPRYYEGDLLIFNDASISYSIFSNSTNEYLGTIESNQGMYINESLDYRLYASYSCISDLSSEMVEKKINQYWYIAIIVIILIIFIIKIWKSIK